MLSLVLGVVSCRGEFGETRGQLEVVHRELDSTIAVRVSAATLSMPTGLTSLAADGVAGPVAGDFTINVGAGTFGVSTFSGAQYGTFTTAESDGGLRVVSTTGALIQTIDGVG